MLAIAPSALVLLAADEHADACTDEQIHDRYHISIRTIERLQERFVEEDLERAIYGKKRKLQASVTPSVINQPSSIYLNKIILAISLRILTFAMKQTALSQRNRTS